MFTKHTTADEMKGAHDQHTKRGTRRGMRGTILETTNLVTLHMLIRAYNSLGRGGAKKGVKENSTQGGFVRSLTSRYRYDNDYDGDGDEKRGYDG